MRATAHRLQQDLRREPTTAELAEAMGTSEKDVKGAQLAGDQYRAASLDTPVRDESDQALVDTIPDDAGDPYDRVVTLVSLRAAMEDLDSRERLILRLRFTANMTQRQIGERIGVSQMQVSRLLSSVCSRLRARLDGEGSRPVS